MTTLVDIQSQIQKLQAQADEIRAREFDATVREIVDKMQAFGITLKDLENALPGKARKVGSTKIKTNGKPSATVAAKYRGPNGETWSGRGLTPRWLATLVSQGQSKDSFAVNAE